jgi:hypothetical protein
MAAKRTRPSKKKAIVAITLTVVDELSEEISKVAAAWSAIAGIATREVTRLTKLKDIQITRGK